MKALTAAEMREVDRLTTERFGVSGRALMDAAGATVAERALTWIGEWMGGKQKSHGVTEAQRRAEEKSRRGAGGQGSASTDRQLSARKGAGEPRVVVLCGKGNNGGDGFVAADLLRSAGATVRVFLFGELDEVRGDALGSIERWTGGGGEIARVLSEADWTKAFAAVRDCDVLVDALLGTGLRGGATALMARAIEQINQFSDRGRRARPGLILAVDTPSGLPSDGDKATGPVLYAHEAVTFTAPKVGQLISPDAEAAGQLFVREIGSPRELAEQTGKSAIRWAEAREFAGMRLVRQVNSNKGKYGHVLVVAGSVGKSGAAELASYAALRTGAGLVTVATAEPMQPVVAGAFAEYMTEPLTATAAGTIARANLQNGRWAAAMKDKTVLAMGPGLGQEAETQEFVRAVVRNCAAPLVLDADGLNAFSGDSDALRDRPGEFLAITPHPGEMARLLGSSVTDVQKNRLQTAREAAERWNAHVVLKGFHTIVAGPKGDVFVSTPGNPGMAKGGSGDVLTGVLAGVTGQFGTGDWARVLALGVELHGRAADVAVRRTDESGLLAHEIADAMPLARRELLEELRRDG